jgi:hypothetical protein
MADADDVRHLALALPDVTETSSDGSNSYPSADPGKPRVIRADIAVLYVGDEAEKLALLLGEPDVSSLRLPTTSCRAMRARRARCSTMTPIRQTQVWGK